MEKRRAKIVCTVGPSSDSYQKIIALSKAGMDVARLNFSHGTHEYFKTTLKNIRRVSAKTEKAITILQDLQGPKIRIQKFRNGKIELKPGDDFTLTARNILGDDKIASVSYKSFNRDVKKGDTVLLDDGLIKLKVKRIEQTDVHCKVIYGGVLSDKKGLNLPASILSVDALTVKDKSDLLFGLKNEVDYIALSFVRKADDIKKIKSIIKKQNRHTPVIAKIEKPQAVNCIEDIIDAADAIMVARGDLGVEVNAEEVPPIQKRIISKCNEIGKPVITATQMLDSMMHNSRPTRAEASDVANAILDGTDAVMLSGETATGKFPVESVKMMSRIIEIIEKSGQLPKEKRKRRIEKGYAVSEAIGYSAGMTADLVRAKAIICLTQSGSTAQMIARYRPDEPIIAITPNESTLRHLSLVWGVRGYLLESLGENIESAIDDVKILLKTKKVLKKGDKIIFTAGLPFFMRRITNMLRIEEIN